MLKDLDLSEEFGLWLRALGYRPSSRARYESEIVLLLGYLDQRQQNLSESNLNAYLQHELVRPNQRRSGGLSSKTLDLKFSVLQVFVGFMALLKDQHFVLDIPKIEVCETVRLPLSRLQINSLYQAISGKNRLRDRAFMAVYYGCGLRRSEGLQLELKDVLLSRKLLYVRRGKFGKSRYVPLTNRLVEDLKNYIHYDRPTTKSNHLFIGRSGKPFNGGSYPYCLKQWQEKSGINQPLSLHVLRHSIATHLLANGMSVDWVSQFLGHRSLVSTQRYTHVR